ncbi:hypothetical protein B0H13DRAFT_2359603 [Mycena leptocephala]|nr:hypothetical protein B0H13DRAFT_2359603 [Mycena leptocephala]
MSFGLAMSGWHWGPAACGSEVEEEFDPPSCATIRARTRREAPSMPYSRMGEERQNPRGAASGNRVEDAAGGILRRGSVGVRGLRGGDVVSVGGGCVVQRVVAEMETKSTKECTRRRCAAAAYTCTETGKNGGARPMALLWQTKMQQQALRSEKSDKEDAQRLHRGAPFGKLSTASSSVQLHAEPPYIRESASSTVQGFALSYRSRNEYRLHTQPSAARSGAAKPRARIRGSAVRCAGIIRGLLTSMGKLWATSRGYSLRGDQAGDRQAFPIGVRYPFHQSRTAMLMGSWRRQPSLYQLDKTPASARPRLPTARMGVSSADPRPLRMFCVCGMPPVFAHSSSDLRLGAYLNREVALRVTLLFPQSHAAPSPPSPSPILDVLWILPSQYLLRKPFSSWRAVPPFAPISSVLMRKKSLVDGLPPSVEVLFDEIKGDSGLRDLPPLLLRAGRARMAHRHPLAELEKGLSAGGTL